MLESTAAYKGYACPKKGVKAIAQQCAICGKKPVAGNNVSHSKVRTRRRFMPNLQAATVVISGKRVKARVCTRCLRTSAKHAAV
jgi:large subunit ribosomal protein L28